MNSGVNVDRSILERLFSSEVKVAILVLFHGNPGITDTSEGVARRIGRTGREIQSDLDDLISLGMLKKRTLGKHMEVIYLDRTGNKNIQNSLDLYFKALHSQ